MAWGGAPLRFFVAGEVSPPRDPRRAKISNGAAPKCLGPRRGHVGVHLDPAARRSRQHRPVLRHVREEAIRAPGIGGRMSAGRPACAQASLREAPALRVGAWREGRRGCRGRCRSGFRARAPPSLDGVLISGSARFVRLARRPRAAPLTRATASSAARASRGAFCPWRCDVWPVFLVSFMPAGYTRRASRRKDSISRDRSGA